jgi:hypothetical protein
MHEQDEGVAEGQAMKEQAVKAPGIDEGRLFEDLCELAPTARARELARLDAEAPAVAARLRRLLAIDEAYGAHTARSVMPHELPDPVDGINDIGPFRLLERIGRGGMGVVYRAERRSGFAQQVALKIMPRFAGDEAGRERFARERRILAQLRHPNICTILDGGELPDGTPWLAMEYVPGETLCAWSAARGLDLRARVALFLQLCDAVQYAHRNLVVHRDLKDSNVLVDDAGHLKLLDFGIARSLAPGTDGHTLAQDAFFSPMTAAPEQIRGERVSVGADVHALGALLHQLLAGRLPFEAAKLPPLALQRAILEIVPPRMSDVTAPGAIAAEALRGDLDAIVAHCLRKDPSERYAGVGELARDLRAWQSGHPISIARDDRAYRLRKFLRRHRLPAALATITAAGVLAALAVTLWQAAELRTQRDAADAARQRSEIDRDRARAVAAFVRETFEAADPGRAAEGGLLARDLIARGKRRLPTLSAQQDVQAELALLLAESDAGLGLLRESRATLAAHAAGIDALAGADTGIAWRAATLRLSNAIALDPDGAALDAGLAALSRQADRPARRVEVAGLRERLLSKRSRFEDAARTLEAAWTRDGHALSEARALRLRVDLGGALVSAGRLDDARRLFDGIDRIALRRQDPALQIRALRLIVRERQRREAPRGEIAAAVAEWRATAERLYGADSLAAASAYVWSIDLTDDARTQDALMAKAYAIQREKLPASSTERAHAEYNMASFLLDLRGRADRAEPHFAEAVRIGRGATSRAHGDVRLFEATWARVLNALGQHRRLIDALSAPPTASTPEDMSRLGALRLELAEAARALGKPAQAQAEVDAVRRLWRDAGTPLPDQLAVRIAAFERGRAPRDDAR